MAKIFRSQDDEQGVDEAPPGTMVTWSMTPVTPPRRRTDARGATDDAAAVYRSTHKTIRRFEQTLLCQRSYGNPVQAELMMIQNPGLNENQNC